MTERHTDICVLVPRFRAGIDTLIRPHVGYIANGLRRAPSLLDQLQQSIAGEQGSGGHSNRSMPPLWVDAIDTIEEINWYTAQWIPLPGANTTTRLESLRRIRAWRQHDTIFLRHATRRLGGWARTVDGLLNPRANRHISAPCPACSAETAYRRDSAGETVRVPALQITDRGCICLACRASWAPEYYLFLCGLLGFELPAGVLE